MKVPNFTFCRGLTLEHKTTTFFFFSWTLIHSFRLELQKNLPTFEELDELESNKRDKVWSSANSLFKSRFRSRCRRWCLIGTLRSDNGDVDENVAEKQTSHHFKLFRDYPTSPCYLKEGDFEWSWRKGNALKFGQRWYNLLPCRSRSQINLKFGHFTS